MADESMRENGPMTPSKSDEQEGILWVYSFMDEDRLYPRPSAKWLQVMFVLGATGLGLGIVEVLMAVNRNTMFPFVGKFFRENMSSKRCIDCCATLRSQPCACVFNQTIVDSPSRFYVYQPN